MSKPKLATERLAKTLCEGAGIGAWQSLARDFQRAWLRHHSRSHAFMLVKQAQEVNEEVSDE